MSLKHAKCNPLTKEFFGSKNKFANLYTSRRRKRFFQKDSILTKWILIVLLNPDVIILGMPVNVVYLISSAHSSKTPWARRGSFLPPERKHKDLL